MTLRLITNKQIYGLLLETLGDIHMTMDRLFSAALLTSTLKEKKKYVT